MSKMLSGFHYTSREAWEYIQQTGFLPDFISNRELATFREAVPRCPEKATWVWKRMLEPKEEWIVTALLSDRTMSFDMVLLELEYYEDEAVSIAFNDQGDDAVVNLRCSFGVGKRNMNAPMELIYKPVPAYRAVLVKELNLMEPFQCSSLIPSKT